MKIGLIDVEGHNYPNLPLMKLSAWHKKRGDDVQWYHPLFTGHCDTVYMSKVFSFTPDFDYQIDADKVIKSGTGYAIRLNSSCHEVYSKPRDRALPPWIEHIYPDYDLYGITDTAYGFTSRGCPRGCGFCHVAAKEGRCAVKAANLDEWWRGQKKIVCMDPNILACRDRMELLDQYAQSGASVDFNQGIDIRLVNGEVIDAMRKIRIDNIHFAWDNADDDLSGAFKNWSDNIGRKYHGDYGTVYCLTNYGDGTDTQHADKLLRRIYALRDLGFRPCVMIYQKETAPKVLRDIQRWCNNVIIFKSTKRFEEYD